MNLILYIITLLIIPGFMLFIFNVILSSKNKYTKFENNYKPILTVSCGGIFNPEKSILSNIILLTTSIIPVRITVYDDFVIIKYYKTIILNYNRIKQIEISEKNPPAFKRLATKWYKMSIIHDDEMIPEKIDLYSDLYYNSLYEIKKIIDEKINSN